MMKQPLIPVLITRAAPQAQRFAQSLRAALPDRLQLVIAPLMQAEFLNPPLPRLAFGAVILTSETGAAAAGRLIAQGHVLPKRTFCVGDRTAEAAISAGLEPLSAGGAAADLLALILSHPDPGAMLYLHGEDRAADLAQALRAQRLVHSVVAYRQTPCPLTPEAMTLLGQDGLVIAPIFSPRSARLLAQALPKALSAQLIPVTISENATRALPPDLAEIAQTAAAPDAKAVLEAVIVAINRLWPRASP